MATTPTSRTPAEKIAAISKPEVEEIPFEFISRPERKITKLVNKGEPAQAIKSQSKFFDFEFKEPLCITSLTIEVSEFNDGSVFEYKWVGADGIEHHGTQSHKDGTVYIPINGVAKSISFKPPRLYFTKPYVNKVRVFGFALKDAENFITYAQSVENVGKREIKIIDDETAKLEKFKIEVAALQATRGILQQDIEKFQSQYGREQNKLKKVDIDLKEAIAKLAETERGLAADLNKLRESRLEIGTLTEKKSELSTEIDKREGRLSELSANIDLFPSELSGFSKQGAKDSRIFFALSFLPIIIIGIMFFLLTRGAADLTTKITGSEDINIAALAVSRAPYVVISATIIGVSYYIARMLILEMIRISRQRLSLTKISILAKDISVSIDSDLDLDDETKYSLRLKLKMEMMRDHLKDYLSKDFLPSLPRNVSPAGISSRKQQTSDEDHLDDTAI